MTAAAADLEREVADLVRLVLKLPDATDASLDRRGLDAWDSLKHMELVFALEDRYGVEFAEDEFAALDSPAAIAAAIRRHRAA